LPRREFSSTGCANVLARTLPAGGAGQSRGLAAVLLIGDCRALYDQDVILLLHKIG